MAAIALNPTSSFQLNPNSVVAGKSMVAFPPVQMGASLEIDRFRNRITHEIIENPKAPTVEKQKTYRELEIEAILDARVLVDENDWSTIVQGRDLSELSDEELDRLGKWIELKRDHDLIAFFNLIPSFQPQISHLEESVAKDCEAFEQELHAAGVPEDEIAQKLNQARIQAKADLFRVFLKSKKGKKLFRDEDITVKLFASLTELRLFTPIEFLQATKLSPDVRLLALPKAVWMGDLAFVKQCFRHPYLSQNLTDEAQQNPHAYPFFIDQPVLASFLLSLFEMTAYSVHPISAETIFQRVRHWPEFQNIPFHRFRFQDFIDFNLSPTRNAKKMHLLFELLSLPNAEQISSYQLCHLHAYIFSHMNVFGNYARPLALLSTRKIQTFFTNNRKWLFTGFTFASLALIGRSLNRI